MDALKNLMFDLALGREIYDEEQDRVISTAEASDAIRDLCFEKLGLSKDSTQRDIARALKRESALELFELIEEVIDRKVAQGWEENEFFNQFVDTKNVADGDMNEFYAKQDIILNVAKVAGDHHDLIVQKLGEGETITIPTSVYAVKVGTDIRMFLTGRKDWSEFIDAVAKAFVKKAQDTAYAEVMNAGSRIPAASQFNKTGVLGNATKETFDTLIEDVETANGNAPVVIMGTKSALRKLNALTDIAWVAPSQKESVAQTGLLGFYEGTMLVEIPQRFANNTTATKLVDNTKLLIMPQVDNKFVKFVDYGETSIEVTKEGDTMNDQQTYEVQRRMGVGTVISRYFGVWTVQ